MTSAHVEDRLIAWRGGELTEPERREVDGHLAACPGCRAALADLERLAAALARPAPPAVHWGAYRVELSDKLARRTAAGAAPAWARRLRPVSVALATGLVALMIYVGTPGPGGRGATGDPIAFEDSALATRLDLISRLELVQRLDLLEEFDVIRGLDGLGERREG